MNGADGLAGTLRRWVFGGALLLVMAGCGHQAASPHGTASAASASRTHHGHGAYITLSPSVGTPGTLVTLTGYLPSMVHVKVGQNSVENFQGNIGFGGFRHGLSISGSSAIKWSRRRPGHFTTQFQVPETAWLTPTGIHPLASGSYTVAIDCFGTDPARGCALGPDQATARFRLTGGYATAPAPHLTFSPSHAQPGQTVKVSGWAPVTSIIGQPFPYQLIWTENGHTTSYGQLGSLAQSLSGELSGTFRVPGTLNNGAAVTTGTADVGLSYTFTRKDAVGVASSNPKGAVSVTLAPTPFSVQTPLTWAQLGTAGPLGEDVNLRPIAVAGSTIALPGLTPGQIWLKRSWGDPGAHWTPVSIAGVAPLSHQSGYPTVWMKGGKPMAYGVTLDGAFPSSYFVVVAAAQKQAGEIPPVYYTAYYTTDAGHTWHAVPVPHGFTAGDFGGFHVQSRTGTVYAEWVRSDGALASEATSNGGSSWSPGFIGCPQAGPCIRFGPAPTMDPGMGVGLREPVWRRNSQGQWVSASSVNTTMNASELVALSPRQTLLINAGSAYPVQWTADGGRHWQDVVLPTPPGVSESGSPYQTLSLLQNGDLLAGVNRSSGLGWYVLSPGADVWRAVPASVLPEQNLTMTLSGPNLWWFEPGTGRNAATPPVVHVINDSQL